METIMVVMAVISVASASVSVCCMLFDIAYDLKKKEEMDTSSGLMDNPNKLQKERAELEKEKNERIHQA